MNDKKGDIRVKQENDRGRDEKLQDGDRGRPSLRGGRHFPPRGGRGGVQNLGQNHHIHRDRNQMVGGLGGVMNDEDTGFVMPDTENREEKKFTGRCRLFVGNLPNECTEDQFKKMFTCHGEVSEVYVNSQRGFGFIRMDTRANAESAKAALDGQIQKGGRMLRVRFATHGAAIRVKYLHPTVSNELLEGAFSQFGEVERAVIIVDDRGRSTGEGIVEFARKPGAVAALKRIGDGVFLMGSNPRPVQVEAYEQKDDIDGLPEKFVSRNHEYQKEREQVPRFCPLGSFEYEYGLKWKDLYQRHWEEEELLRRQFEESVAKVEMEMSNAYMEHQTAMLRQDLLRRQEELRVLEEQHQREIQRRMEMRRLDEERVASEFERRRALGLSGINAGLGLGMRDEQRRQQELYQQQERAMRELRGEHGGSAPPMQPPPAPPSGMGLERGSRQAGGDRNQQQMGHQGMRQSRFDQPPGYQGSMRGGMGGMSDRDRQMMIEQQQQQQQQQQQKEQRQGGGGGNAEHMLVGEDEADYYGESKRARRY